MACNTGALREFISGHLDHDKTQYKRIHKYIPRVSTIYYDHDRHGVFLSRYSYKHIGQSFDGCTVADLMKVACGEYGMRDNICMLFDGKTQHSNPIIMPCLKYYANK